MTLPLSERVKAALLLKPSQFYATETSLGLSRSQRHTAIDVAEIANARNAALHSALVVAVSALEQLKSVVLEHECNECNAVSNTSYSFRPAKDALAAIEKVLGEGE